MEILIVALDGRSSLTRNRKSLFASHWLASDAARFVSGAVLSVDGGLVLGT